MTNQPSSMQMLDCTLRDGGYLTNWDFPLDLIERHIKLTDAVGIDLVEVGFRSPGFRSRKFRGIAANFPPLLLHRLKNQCGETELGLMINESDFESLDEVALNFERDKELGALSFVRVATLYSKLDEALQKARILHEMGFSAFLNIMQCSELHQEDISYLADLREIEWLRGLYFADTLGALEPSDVRERFSRLNFRSGLPIGFHFHDNRSLAYANALVAESMGATYLDGTVLGLGRGAGNCRTEFLATSKNSSKELSALAELVNLWEMWLEKKPGQPVWGPSLEYAFSAQQRIHPTFVQTMIETETLNLSERVAALEALSLKSATRFEAPLLDFGADWFAKPGETSLGVEENFRNRNIALVGTGASAGRYHREVELLLMETEFDTWLVGGHSRKEFGVDRLFISQPLKILTLIEEIGQFSTILGPFSQTPPSVNQLLRGVATSSFDLRLSNSEFGFRDGTVSSPSSRSSIVAMSMLSGVQPKCVILIGFDGYGEGDPRNKEFNVALGLLRESGVDVCSLTPTSFDVDFCGFG